MALMTPPEPPLWRPGGFAERSLFEALRSGLSEEFQVFHDYAYLGEQLPAEGAIDFLVVHRELGILAIECKGEGVRLRGDGSWTRLSGAGREDPLAESPFRQAQRHIRELVAELAPKTARLFPDLGGAFPFTFGHAVAFPLAAASPAEPLPAEASAEILLLAADLARLGERVPGILRFWGRGRTRHPVLDEPCFRQFRKQVLLPRWRLAPSFGARLELEDQALVRLSDEQTEVLRSVAAGPRLCVRGGAGTGKTLLALESARADALAGREVLLVCYNVALARWIAARVAGWGALAERVRAATFHDLCLAAAAAVGDVPRSPPPGDRRAADAYWDEALPGRLRAAVAAGRAPRADAIVVDEGQDLHRRWFDLLAGCLRDPAQGSFVVFSDPAQGVFRRGDALPPFPAVSLGVNFRSTRAIAARLREYAAGAAAPFSRSPEGEPPRIHRQPRAAAAAAGAIERLVDELISEKGVAPGRITIIAPHTKEKSSLRGLATLAAQRLSTDPLEREGAILCTTVQKFKGLESDVVVVIDVAEDDLFHGRSFLYTAASRARLLLHVFALS